MWNVDVPVSDARRTEILAFALPVWHGAQVAIDATMVSPLGRDGQPRGSSARQAGAVLEQAARRKRETRGQEVQGPSAGLTQKVQGGEEQVMELSWNPASSSLPIPGARAGEQHQVKF